MNDKRPRGRWLLVGLLLCLLGAGGGQAQNAKSILDKAVAAYERANGLRVDFSVRTRQGDQPASGWSEGTIQMRGDKFLLETADTKTWFDGTTQWTYVERNEEVNITTPTGEELRFTNPALLLGIHKKGFKPAYKGESTASNGKLAYDIELTPEKRSDITRVELQVEKATGLPLRVEVTARNGVTSTIRVDNIRTGLNQPDATFVFNEEAYPEAEMVDLR